MKRPTSLVTSQLLLSLEREEPYRLDEETRQALITTLADLLLEAYGEATAAGSSTQEGGHE